jgi:hypothetical protein
MGGAGDAHEGVQAAIATHWRAGSRCITPPFTFATQPMDFYYRLNFTTVSITSLCRLMD